MIESLLEAIRPNYETHQIERLEKIITNLVSQLPKTSCAQY
jgi:hypothetical protein